MTAARGAARCPAGGRSRARRAPASPWPGWGRAVRRRAVHRDRLVRDELARLGAGGAEAHAVDDVVQARFEQHQELGTRVALAAGGFLEIAAELLLQHAVHALDLLLFAQLQAEVA